MVNTNDMTTEMLQQRPQDPKAALTGMEQGVFDAVLALSASMEKGMLAGFLVAPSTRGTMVELIFPTAADAPEGAVNPSKKLEAATPAAAIAMAGEVMHRALVLNHQNHGDNQDYIDVVEGNRSLRKGIIAISRGKILTPSGS